MPATNMPEELFKDLQTEGTGIKPTSL